MQRSGNRFQNVIFRSQKEAAWAITNLCLGGTPEQLDSLISAGFLEPYCSLLTSKDHKAITVVLDGLTNLLQVSLLHGHLHFKDNKKLFLFFRSLEYVYILYSRRLHTYLTDIMNTQIYNHSVLINGFCILNSRAMVRDIT